MFQSFTTTTGKSIAIDMSQVVVYYALTTTTTKVFVGNLSYSLNVAPATFSTALGQKSPYIYTEFTDLAGKKININVNAISSYAAISTTTCNIYIGGVTFQVLIAFGDLNTIVLATVSTTPLALFSTTSLNDFVNNSTPQSQKANFLFDRQIDNLGVITMQVDPEYTLPTNFTINPVDVQPTAGVGELSIDYTGTGATVDSYTVPIQFVANSAVLLTIDLDLNVVAMLLAKTEEKVLKAKTEEKVLKAKTEEKVVEEKAEEKVVEEKAAGK